MNKSIDLGKKIFDILIRPRDNDFVDIPVAVAYAHMDDNNIRVIAAEEDVYELLETLVVPKNTVGISLVTTGWAAPLDENGEVEGQPSRHPDKRRVRLIATVTQDDRGSVLEFADDLEVVEDEGHATGSLNDALIRAWNNNPILSW